MTRVKPKKREGEVQNYHKEKVPWGNMIVGYNIDMNLAFVVVSVLMVGYGVSGCVVVLYVGKLF